jgi:hypothetical protein
MSIVSEAALVVHLCECLSIEFKYLVVAILTTTTNCMHLVTVDDAMVGRYLQNGYMAFYTQ